jgi:hypothetical protein
MEERKRALEESVEGMEESVGRERWKRALE